MQDAHCAPNRLLLGIGALLLSLLTGCSAQEIPIAALDHTRCRELGFKPGSPHYDVCVGEVRRQRIGLAADELRD
jgi:hypothetical protein